VAPQIVAPCPTPEGRYKSGSVSGASGFGTGISTSDHRSSSPPDMSATASSEDNPASLTILPMSGTLTNGLTALSQAR
jgi:hypothetical protein